MFGLKSAKGDDFVKGKFPKHFKFITTPPAITILNDLPLDSKNADDDLLSLKNRIGPIFDIVRSPFTKLPFTIAVYGTWGSGKTSAMKWLDAMIDAWNKSSACKKEKGIKIRTLWFYPWRYHTKEDVWRGLIYEVILDFLRIQSTDPWRFFKALWKVICFLIKCLIGIFSLVVNFVYKLEIKKFFNDVSGAYRKDIQPHRAFSNFYRDQFKDWINTSLGSYDRMVIFIDELDRCLPDVMLQVLEALKLYIDIDKIIFIMGVHRDVIEDVVVNKLVENGVKEERALDYLDKMFNYEILLDPAQQPTVQYVKGLFSQIETWGILSDAHITIFGNVVLSMNENNPRKIKRIINNALILGSITAGEL